MNKYQKKPVVVEAVQFNGTNHEEIFDFTGRENIGGSNAEGNFNVLTLEGYKPVPAGYWVIKGVKGEFYPCEDEIFNMTYDRYELVSEEEPVA